MNSNGEMQRMAPFDGLHAVPPASRDIKGIPRFQYLIEYRLFWYFALMVVALLAANRQQMGRFLQTPTFAATKLNNENVVRVPMHARRRFLAKRRIGVCRCLSANESANFHADVADR